MERYEPYVKENPTLLIGGMEYDRATVTEIRVPEGVVSLKQRLFSHCKQLTKVTLPQSLTRIGNHAFLRCESLRTLNIPLSVTTIGTGAFQESGLTNVAKFPSFGITSASFHYCKSLVKVTLPPTLTSIASLAFAQCSALRNIPIPPTVTSVHANAFDGCTVLERLSTASNQSIEEYLRSRFYALQSRYALLTSIQHLTLRDAAEPPTERRRLEQTPLIPGQLNGSRAYYRLTAIELWREIVKFL